MYALVILGTPCWSLICIILFIVCLFVRSEVLLTNICTLVILGTPSWSPRATEMAAEATIALSPDLICFISFCLFCLLFVCSFVRSEVRLINICTLVILGTPSWSPRAAEMAATIALSPDQWAEIADAYHLRRLRIDQISRRLAWPNSRREKENRNEGQCHRTSHSGRNSDHQVSSYQIDLQVFRHLV